MTRSRLLAVVGVGLVLLVAAVAAVALRDGSDNPRFEVMPPEGVVDYDYVIPQGTQARIRAGETIEIMPDRLDVKVGETIRIRNDDVEGVVAGIFYVGSGEEVQMKFRTPGELIGECEVSSSGEFVISVTA